MNAWLPTSPCTPEACADHGGRTAAVPLAVLRLGAAVALLLAGILAAPPVRLLPAGPRHRLVRAWATALVRAFGIRLTVYGGPGLGGGRLVVANHISWLDIPLVAAVLPCRMLAKSDIRAWPVLGRLSDRAGTLFIERDRIRALPATVGRVTRALRVGERVTVFPEGSTWCGRAQGPFRRAAFQAALDARVPVQPVRLAYLRADGSPAGEPSFVGDDPLTASLWRIARSRGIRAEVTLLPRIPPGRHADRRGLAAAAEAAVRGSAGAAPGHATGRRGDRAAVRPPRPGPPAQPALPPATDSDRAKRPAASVHHCSNSSPAAASSPRTPS
ncbi:lysophospholipid acyltransferase family protein [Streptomyces subrutilus]|uniref:lysophospholipid acyltransferase family protein n=1 Tax=Streptomyces subrutilus TaxID=36818 RepID=UPI002E109BB6|nr:1-acyl-sn-glycerol-3-phosphate acyltransferase [Streptomyces subrutilus]